MLGICCIDTEITVFYMVSMVREFSIFTVFCEEIGTRYPQLEGSELFKEAFVKIKINAIGIWRPIIAPPNLLIVNGEWFIWRINGNHLVPCFITFSMVKSSLISEREPSPLALTRTESRTWYEVFLTSEYW